MQRRIATLSLVFAASSAQAAVIHVQQAGATFSPAVVNAAVGDTIHWMWTGGGHTVTSGTNCTPDGLFDGDLSSAATTFSWVVPASAAGDSIGYFCVPHCFYFMTGTINVAASAAPGDLNGDGHVNGIDMTQLLGAWGSADAVCDINDDGVVNALDMSVILANWLP